MRKLLLCFLFSLVLFLSACGKDDYENDYEYDGDEEIQVQQDDRQPQTIIIQDDDDNDDWDND
jgi:hypothetical protein